MVPGGSWRTGVAACAAAGALWPAWAGGCVCEASCACRLKIKEPKIKNAMMTTTEMKVRNLLAGIGFWTRFPGS
jgi:hypothetical protein